MKNKKYYTVGTVPKSNKKKQKTKQKLTTLTHKYSLAVRAWCRHFSEKWQG